MMKPNMRKPVFLTLFFFLVNTFWKLNIGERKNQRSKRCEKRKGILLKNLKVFKKF